VHGTGEAGIDTPGLSAVMALNGEANLPLPLHADARQGAGGLSLERLDYVPGPRVFCLAIDLTKAAANTDLFSNIDLLQL